MAEIFKLSQKIYIDGAECGELPYDFEAMTARDRLRVGMEMAADGFATTTVEEYDTVYHMYLFAKAVEVASSGKIIAADVLRISAKDSQRAGALARDFFYLSV